MILFTSSIAYMLLLLLLLLLLLSIPIALQAAFSSDI
jgi:hypothetical protein